MVPWELYASRLSSAWGDRMWRFAVGLFMVALSPESLKWPAIFGLTESLAVVFLGSVIGRWVDKTARLKASRTSLTLQNLLVVICAVCVALTFYFRDTLIHAGQGWGLTAACSLIVIVGTLAELASTAMSIAVYKDWLAIIADGDNQLLARMNSTCRSIDLATNIIAPIAVGQVMYFVSHIMAAVIIAAWNVVSFFVESFLLWRIYKKFPKLAQKEKAPKAEVELLKEKTEETSGDVSSNGKAGKKDRKETQKKGGLAGFTKTWKIYFNHEVRNAGIGLALLYLTVLGFDSITVGYAYSQGVPESLIGILLAVGAGTGLLGSVAFPVFERWIGVERTGLYGFGFEVLCLTLCVASVWAPGSPFEPSFIFNATFQDPFAGSTTNSSIEDYSNFTSNSTFGDAPTVSAPDSYTSVALLMSGIIAARFGLWMADLSVNQVLQLVEDNIRGTINGVQSSMNMIFNTLKFLLVIACPWPQTFGILVCISFTAVSSGWAFFCSYSFMKRGHLLPFHKVVRDVPPDKIHRVTVNGSPSKQKGESNREENDRIDAAA